MVHVASRAGTGIASSLKIWGDVSQVHVASRVGTGTCG